jgi:transposase-like protein
MIMIVSPNWPLIRSLASFEAQTRLLEIEREKAMRWSERERKWEDKFKVDRMMNQIRRVK